MRRRTFLRGALGAAGAAALGGCRSAEPDRPLSPAAASLLERAWEGLDPARVVDCHVHLVGTGDGGSGCYVNPRMRSPLHPLRLVRYRAFMRAGGVEREAGGDRAYLERLAALASAGARRGRYVLLALDAVHREDGSRDLEATEFATPDEWVLAAVRRRPDLFLAGVSVHPYRRDALARLEAGAAAGAALVKWLPSAQRIDPASPRCDLFYERLSALRLPLLVHAGEEQAAVVPEEAQELGNPLRLRRALERGVEVVVAHCASLGECPDTDTRARPRVPAFDLFLRLAREAGGRLRGDLSALPAWNRARHLPALLAARDLHPRLSNGSDYPVPAVDVVVRLKRLVDLGVLDPALRAPLRELWGKNVLWFDLALKRSLSLGGVRFPAGVFMPGWLRRA